MARVWQTPSADYESLYADMLSQVHLLVAGATGSGKSTVLAGIMQAALIHSPAKARFILIDPKRVELKRYAHLPHVITYGQEGKSALKALYQAMNIVEDRYKDMEKKKLLEYDGSHVYVVIDEIIPIITDKDIAKEFLRVLQKLLAIARAARVHVIACSQHIPSIPTALRCNFDSRVALRCDSAQDSRNICGVKGAENFPSPVASHKAMAIYAKGADKYIYELPFTKVDKRDELISWWMKHNKPKFSLFAH